jgi:hypothetical protein
MRYRSVVVGFATALSAVAGACGGETSLWVEVDLGGRDPGEEVDLVHLELRDADEPLIGRNFDLSPADVRPTFHLTPGDRTPDEFELVAYAYLDTILQGQSPPQPSRFEDGEKRRVVLQIPAP